jgi:hypothetical protein
VSAAGIRVECKDAFKKWSELLWKGHGSCTGAKNALLAPILHRNDRCAKTGLGQNIGKVEKRVAFCAGTTDNLQVGFQLCGASCKPLHSKDLASVSTMGCGENNN